MVVISLSVAGVCLIIGAWNYPLHLTLLPVVGAIAAGITIIIISALSHYLLADRFVWHTALILSQFFSFRCVVPAHLWRM
uniref:Aldehyde dehydrogenase domain-containing protein n=1 Tax=uncultured SAR11 cluster alpha proteobacterium H17925_45G17 TaxID=715038 RepID=E7CA21_9PROT|nr:hypothetical protein [uncultured SAR11 cluster alpha proteobacterium H17925_45G17]